VHLRGRGTAGDLQRILAGAEAVLGGPRRPCRLSSRSIGQILRRGQRNGIRGVLRVAALPRSC
jgi:hypothetical protein